MDAPGTMRRSPENGTYAILTTDRDEAPWIVFELSGRRYWASHDEVQGWEVREPSWPAN